jgi:3-hydroxyisobutyrate dehydrogenase
MLPSSPQVKAVYHEANGILHALQSLKRTDSERTLCIDSTTLDVDVARQVARNIVEAGAHMVDAPVSGGLC